MRLFVGVPLPSEVTAAAAAVLPASRALRAVRPEVMHVTLAFLGEVPEARVDDAAAAVRAAAAGHHAFAASVNRVGTFPEHAAPRIVWLGIGEGADAFAALARAVRAALTARALPFDGKPFRPHVTLARVRDGTDRAELRAIADAIGRARISAARFRVEGFLLLSSELGPQGPRYTSRAAVPLEVGSEPERT